MHSSDAIISARSVDFYYGAFKALSQISMDILPQKVTALMAHLAAANPLSYAA
jgi:ABC-type phosphate transport system ATPase subunit